MVILILGEQDNPFPQILSKLDRLLRRAEEARKMAFVTQDEINAMDADIKGMGPAIVTAITEAVADEKQAVLDKITELEAKIAAGEAVDLTQLKADIAGFGGTIVPAVVDSVKNILPDAPPTPEPTP